MVLPRSGDYNYVIVNNLHSKGINYFHLKETSVKDDIIFSGAHLEREELTLLFLDLKTSPLFITFFPDVEKFLVLFIC